jgi:hypothetical protein
VWHPHNQNVGATGSGLSGVATVSSTLGVLRAYSPNSTSASSSNLSTVHMGGLTCITQPTTELGSEDTVIAQFLRYTCFDYLLQMCHSFFCCLFWTDYILAPSIVILPKLDQASLLSYLVEQLVLHLHFLHWHLMTFLLV